VPELSPQSRSDASSDDGHVPASWEHQNQLAHRRVHLFIFPDDVENEIASANWEDAQGERSAFKCDNGGMAVSMAMLTKGL
jgi:hypothetical protein